MLPELTHVFWTKNVKLKQEQLQIARHDSITADEIACSECFKSMADWMQPPVLPMIANCTRSKRARIVSMLFTCPYPQVAIARVYRLVNDCGHEFVQALPMLPDAECEGPAAVVTAAASVTLGAGYTATGLEELGGRL